MLSQVGKRVVPSSEVARITRLGMSPRQQELNLLWAWYRCLNYHTRTHNWDGSKHMDPVSRESMASAGYIPPGMYDAQLSTLPLKMRRPNAPYRLVKVIVDRFTGLLFSERLKPKLQVEGSPKVQAFINAMATQSRLWARMVQARTYGGAMGAVAVGFKFLKGRAVVEVHDPRWLHPKFKSRDSFELKALEKRYMYPQEEQDHTGKWSEVWYWYRRIIDEKTDIVFKPVKVDDGEEPVWLIAQQVTHGFGFCPVVWAQNLPVDDALDGDPDCHGVYEAVEQMDGLLAQANRGTVANCDPTLMLSTDQDFSTVKKGSDNAIRLEKGGSARYLEISASGIKQAMDQVQKLRGYVLEVAQCVLDHPETSAARTATEIDRAYSSMLTKADILREQYGEHLIKPLIEMMVSAAVQVMQSTQPVAGKGVVTPILDIPVKEAGETSELRAVLAEAKLRGGGLLRLKWPRYFQPSLDATQKAVAAAVQAKAGVLVDDEHLIAFIAPYLGIDDPATVTKNMAGVRMAEQKELDEAAMIANANKPPPKQSPEPKKLPQEAPGGEGIEKPEAP